MAMRDNLTALLHRHRVGHLATADANGAPHLVPVCFAYNGQEIYTAIDHKPKRQTGYRIKRIRNILDNPQVAFLVDHYDEDWHQLYYVLMRGPATILETGPEHQQALDRLEEKYPQYRERHLASSTGLVIKIVPTSVQYWSWQDTPTSALQAVRTDAEQKEP
ncbi:MAG TPA: TIGR03668 family PPOX class F420-dependent oxidoreductase [Candidatus Tectomicrobia bacterium]|jgi:PPOX class probable F420-dependent enzyme